MSIGGMAWRAALYPLVSTVSSSCPQEEHRYVRFFPPSGPNIGSGSDFTTKKLFCPQKGHLFPAGAGGSPRRSRSATFASSASTLAGSSFSFFQSGIRSKIFSRSEALMMATVSLPKIVLNDAGITRGSLAITQIIVFRKHSGEPVLSIIRQGQREDIELDEDSRAHLANLLARL